MPFQYKLLTLGMVSLFISMTTFTAVTAQADEPCRLAAESGACTECPCGSCDEASERDAWNPSLLTEATAMQIRVRFVRILNNSNEGATQQQVDDQFDDLNAAFEPYRIQFVRGLPDTTHNNNTYYNFCLNVPVDMTCFCPDRNGDCLNHLGQPSAIELALKQSYGASPDEMLNIFVTNVSPSGTQGLGYYPWWAGAYGPLNGILVDKDHFGGLICGSDPQNYPKPCRLLVHEVGHELGLYHTFDSAIACGCETEENCDESNDSCCDTPPSAVEAQYSCQGTENAPCSPEDPTPPDSDYTNYMGYAWDGCWDSFTPQQVRRMHCWVCDRLPGWIDSPDCNENEIPDVCEITRGDSEDCDENGVLDECEGLGSCCGPSEFCHECMNEEMCDLLYGIWGPPGNCMICAMSTTPPEE